MLPYSNEILKLEVKAFYISYVTLNNKFHSSYRAAYKENQFFRR